MTVSMVERVARAIYERMGTVMGAEKPSDWGDVGPDHDKARADWLEISRAAISEVWESITPEMIEGMEEMYMPMGEMRAAWDGAFFAALNEQVS